MSDDFEKTPFDQLPRTRIGRIEAVSRMGLEAGREFVKNSAAGLLSGQSGSEAFSSGRRAAAEEIFDTLGRMRGVAAKVGQILAQSPGSVADEYVDRLFDLSNRVPPMSYGMVKTQVFGDLGCNPHEAFQYFEREPIAAASIGQVHRAITKDGVIAAVKVQYPGVADSVRADLQNVRSLLGPLQRVLRVTDLESTFSEAEQRLLEELDYVQEAKNLRDFLAAFQGDPTVLIPRVLPLSSRRILVMEFVEGVAVREYTAQNPSEEARRRYGESILRSSWTALFHHGLLHADPNPGNFFFRPDGRLGVLDFGCVQRLPPQMIDALRGVIAAARAGRHGELIDALIRAGMLQTSAPAHVQDSLARATAVWVKPYRGQVHEFGDGSYVREMFAARGEFNKAVQSSSGVSFPSEWLFYGRYLLGNAHMLHRLGVRANFGPLLEQFV